jgi:putative endonuclease|tara:strand:- start:158 stop:412 length:255 start_codon:yes stop_codon:yes gene_type:complete
MNFYVYLICTKRNDNSLVSYVGYTNNLKKRLSAHNSSKGAKFTRGKQWKLIYKKKFNLKIEAMKYEYKLKNDRHMRKKLKSKFA